MTVIKTIKFDLPIDGVKVKNLEELRQHFTTEIVDLYQNGLLLRWLQSQGEVELTQALHDLASGDGNDALLSSLCRLFNVTINDVELLSMLANYHANGIKIDTTQLNYKDKYDALVKEIPRKGRIMGFDNEFIGSEIDINMLTKMHKYHTGEDIVLVPVYISRVDEAYSFRDSEVQNPANYLQAVGSLVSYDEVLFKLIGDNSYNNNAYAAYAPCDGVIYKKVRVTLNSLKAFERNAESDIPINLNPIVVAYLRVDCY